MPAFVSPFQSSIPLPDDFNDDEAPQDLPLYGNDDAPLQDLIVRYYEIFVSRGECITSRSAYDAAVAAMEAARLVYEDAKVVVEAAKQRVLFADRRRSIASSSYAHMITPLYIDDPANPEETEVGKSRKRHRRMSGGKGKGNERGGEIMELDAA